MKRWTTLALAVALTACLSACCTQHTYSEATCTEPATCTECGKTSGEALGHDWVEADCEKPKICARCGATEGEPLGHSWVDADCENPKTCAVCGATEGEALGHTWEGRTLEDAGSCAVCGKAGESPITITEVDTSMFAGSELICPGVAPDGSVTYLTISRGENETKFLLYDGEKNIIRTDTVGSLWSYAFVDEVYMVSSGHENGMTYTVIDFGGNEIYTDSIYPGWVQLVITNSPIDGVVKVHSSETDLFFGFIDIGLRNSAQISLDKSTEKVTFYSSRTDDVITIRCEVDSEGNFYLGDSPMECSSYDTSLWSFYRESSHRGYTMVGTADNSQWGFLDENGNTLAMYKDCSDFAPCGYALASANGKTYDLIDTNFNVVCENVFTAAGCGNVIGTNLFQLQAKDGSTTWYCIE